MIETKEKFKIKFKTDNIAKLVEDTKKPMSLNEIMSKYGVSYPFQVLCVKELHNTGTGNPSGMLGKEYTFIRNSIHNKNRAIYLGNVHRVNKNSKKFIYQE